MFKLGNLESELFDSMNSNLKSKEIESEFKFDKLAKVIDLLNLASEIFENENLMKESNEITNIIEDLSKGINNG